MARTIGAKAYSREEKQYIKDNWMTTTDDEMSIYLRRSADSISKYRYLMGFTRYVYKLELNSTKALICELYMSGKTIDYIQAVVGRRKYDIGMVIYKCLTVVPLTDKSRLVKFKSKV